MPLQVELLTRAAAELQPLLACLPADKVNELKSKISGLVDAGGCTLPDWEEKNFFQKMMTGNKHTSKSSTTSEKEKDKDSSSRPASGAPAAASATVSPPHDNSAAKKALMASDDAPPEVPSAPPANSASTKSKNDSDDDSSVFTDELPMQKTQESEPGLQTVPLSDTSRKP